VTKIQLNDPDGTGRRHLAVKSTYPRGASRTSDPLSPAIGVPFVDSQPSNSHPMATPSKMNRGNRRTGVARGRSGRCGSLSWRDDAMVMERVDLVRSLTARGFTTRGMLPGVTEWCRDRGLLPVTEGTVHNDRRRARELLAEERAHTADIENDLRVAHLEALREIQLQAWVAFFATDTTSPSRPRLLDTIRSAIEAQAKLDGSARPAQIRLTSDHEGREADARISALMEEFIPDPARRSELALRIVGCDLPARD
jgi:hypothetical protein